MSPRGSRITLNGGFQGPHVCLILSSNVFRRLFLWRVSNTRLAGPCQPRTHNPSRQLARMETLSLPGSKGETGKEETNEKSTMRHLPASVVGAPPYGCRCRHKAALAFLTFLGDAQQHPCRAKTPERVPRTRLGVQAGVTVLPAIDLDRYSVMEKARQQSFVWCSPSGASWVLCRSFP